MKYPALLQAEEALAQLDLYDSIIDVRSPSEFALDHIPGAINCPVLDDTQRAEVGLLYKQAGPFEAKKIGAAIVARNISLHLEQAFHDKPRDWKPLIYCWRGGNRSGAMAHILAKIGWSTMQLDGGYKAYRRTMTGLLEQQAQTYSFRVICGTTGSGKSRLLQMLAAAGSQVLDLEQLAAHRGSVLGRLPTEPQPSQKMFESRIWQTLRHFTPNRVVFVESESKKVGDLRVPEILMDSIRASACITLNTAMQSRIDLLMEEYEHLAVNPESLNRQLHYLTSVHGHDKIRRWQSMASDGQMRDLVHELLVEHYDPAYLRSIERNFPLRVSGPEITISDISNASFSKVASVLMQQDRASAID